jgi:hypothetical protein
MGQIQKVTPGAERENATFINLEGCVSQKMVAGTGFEPPLEASTKNTFSPQNWANYDNRVLAPVRPSDLSEPNYTRSGSARGHLAPTHQIESGRLIFQPNLCSFALLDNEVECGILSSVVQSNTPLH